MDKLAQANELQAQIKELDHFIFTVNPQWDVKRGNGSYDIDVIVKTKVEKSFKIFGSRWFGIGTHQSEIRVPNALLIDLYESATKLRSELKKAIDKIIPNT